VRTPMRQGSVTKKQAAIVFKMSRTSMAKVAMVETEWKTLSRMEVKMRTTGCNDSSHLLSTLARY